MSKNRKIYSLIGIFVLVFVFFSIVKTTDADVTVWQYETSPIPHTYTFKTQLECGNNRALYLQNTNGQATMCAPSLISGEPRVDDIYEIEPTKTGDEIIFEKEYKLLAPIGDFDKIDTDNISMYFNRIFLIAIGLAGAMAVVVLIVGGIQWMGTDSVFGKTKAKEQITSAIFGLLIALGSYALLNTIDPALLGTKGLSVDQVNIELVDLPDAGRGDAVDPGYAKGEYKYYTDQTVSSGVASALTKLKDGWQIDKFRVYPGNNRMVISLIKDGKIDNTSIITVSPGASGYSEIGKGITGDKKTPKGNWKILEIRTSKDGKPVFNKDGVNMGATFWLLNPTTKGERGIGMHGNKRGTLGKTAGCLRLKNSDLLALLPYVTIGTEVNIID